MSASATPSVRNAPRFVPRSNGRNSLWNAVGLPERGPALHEAVREGVPYRVFERLIKATGFSQRALCNISGIARGTLQRRARAGRFNQSEGDRLYRIAEVYCAAVDLHRGDERAAGDWLSRPAKGLGGARPIDQLQTMVGTEQVLDLIGRIEYGVLT
ncbi:MAG: DUF2384 domain-containing protein [Salinisphaera sp.]|nr:DUF2384 domain-containing protein [Salinisphaera sp.]